MRQLQLSASLLAAVLLLGGCAEKKLEHFKFYEVTDGHEPGSLDFKYRNQFDVVHYKDSRALDMTHLGIAVDKNGEGIEDSDHHLTWYTLDGPQERLRQVSLQHQFGSRECVIGSPKVLLVPAQKVPHPAPSGLNHFVCYEVLRPHASLGQTVTLKDQLKKVAVTVAIKEPDFFCLPSDKIFRDVETKRVKVKGPMDHLLIYKIEPREGYDSIDFKRVTDQIWPGNVLREFRPHYLAVPAQKTAWSPYTGEPPPPAQ